MFWEAGYCAGGSLPVTSAPAHTTLATVAASAGVLVATVSKVINGRTDVDRTTRARIQDLLLQLEYVP